MNTLLAHWIHDLDPIFLHFTRDFGLRYYGLAYVLGFAGGWWLMRAGARAGRAALDAEGVDDLIMWVMFGVALGGRLGHFLLYHPEQLFHPPWAFFLIWEGGMASHGGFAGVMLALAWFAHRRKTSFLALGDLVVSVVPLGLLFGRVANFINGELWGKVSNVPWAVIFPASGDPGQPVSLIAPRHPSQLYQAALEGALLLAWTQWRFWRTDVTRARPGRLAGEFLAGYALVRMLGEMFREPDAALIMGVSRGTFYSFFLLAAGAALVALVPKGGKPPTP